VTVADPHVDTRAEKKALLLGIVVRALTFGPPS
jgi:hypothetical protein